MHVSILLGRRPAHPLARPWLAAVGACLLVVGLGPLASRVPDPVELVTMDRGWSQGLVGTVAFPHQDVEDGPVWTHCLERPGPAPVAVPGAGTSQVDGMVFHSVSVTGYSSRAEETDETPFLTAINTITAPGVVALSRDLLRTFTPGAPFDFGDRILISGVGVYQVEDTMHPRWSRRVDVWFPSTAEAVAWGRRDTYIARVNETTPIDPFEIPLALLTQPPIDLRHQSGLSTPNRILE